MQFALEKWNAAREQRQRAKSNGGIGVVGRAKRWAGAKALVAAALVAAPADAGAVAMRLEWVLPEYSNSGAVLTTAGVLRTELRCSAATHAFSGAATAGYVDIAQSDECALVVVHVDTVPAIEWTIDPATGDAVLAPGVDPDEPPTHRPRDSMASARLTLRPSAVCGDTVTPRPGPHYAAPVLAIACADPDVVLPSGAQVQTLRDGIAANAELAALLAAADWAGLASALQRPTVRMVWPLRVTREQFAARLPWAALRSITSTRWRVIDAMLALDTIAPGDAAVSAGLADALGPAAAATLIDGLKRPATVLESIFAPDSGALVVSGAITADYLRSLLTD